MEATPHHIPTPKAAYPLFTLLRSSPCKMGPTGALLMLCADLQKYDPKNLHYERTPPREDTCRPRLSHETTLRPPTTRCAHRWTALNRPGGCVSPLHTSAARLPSRPPARHNPPHTSPTRKDDLPSPPAPGQTHLTALRWKNYGRTDGRMDGRTVNENYIMPEGEARTAPSAPAGHSL